MKTKLTLKLDNEVITRAKMYAQIHKISLSKMVEQYFKSLGAENKKNHKKYSPLIQELSGIIHLDFDHNLENDYINFLNKKYK